MQAQIGDRVVLHSRRVGQPERTGEIVEIRGDHGSPPYVVRWDDAHQALFFPGSDATIEPGGREHR